MAARPEAGDLTDADAAPRRRDRGAACRFPAYRALSPRPGPVKGSPRPSLHGRGGGHGAGARIDSLRRRLRALLQAQRSSASAPSLLPPRRDNLEAACPEHRPPLSPQGGFPTHHPPSEGRPPLLGSEHVRSTRRSPQVMIPGRTPFQIPESRPRPAACNRKGPATCSSDCTPGARHRPPKSRSSPGRAAQSSRQKQPHRRNPTPQVKPQPPPADSRRPPTPADRRQWQQAQATSGGKGPRDCAASSRSPQQPRSISSRPALIAAAHPRRGSSGWSAALRCRRYAAGSGSGRRYSVWSMGHVPRDEGKGAGRPDRERSGSRSPRAPPAPRRSARRAPRRALLHGDPKADVERKPRTAQIDHHLPAPDHAPRPPAYSTSRARTRRRHPLPLRQFRHVSGGLRLQLAAGCACLVVEHELSLFKGPITNANRPLPELLASGPAVFCARQGRSSPETDR